jgi:hypothetical protein
VSYPAHTHGNQTAYFTICVVFISQQATQVACIEKYVQKKDKLSKACPLV